MGRLSRWLLLATLAPSAALAQQVPVFLTVQLGGGQGTVAVGGGCRLARQRLEPELLVGLVPRRLAGRAQGIITLKTTYLPVTLGRGAWQAQPVAASLYASFTPGRHYFLTNRTASRYPRGYYWWSSAVRVGAAVGTRASRGAEAGSQAGRTALYAELGTNDLYLVSWLSNRTLRLPDILTLGLGSKVTTR